MIWPRRDSNISIKVFTMSAALHDTAIIHHNDNPIPATELHLQTIKAGRPEITPKLR